MNVFSLFAKIGLDTSEYESGLDSAGGKIHSFGEKLKSGLATAAKIGAGALTAASAAVGALTKQSLDGYAEYEQLVGGVETLFKNSADIVMGYAENAYKTAGLSANEYMETVTSFSASLLQSLGGDTEAAAQYADMAITDMSDNANKMGTAMDSIQNAYQGFAKQNFTMLDNLKLGYGGTKEEMQRLLEDAEKLSGIEYDISSYADIVDAIHVVQTEMGITGTTAAEAASTIQGSVSAAKSAWENLVAGIGNENADLDTLIGNFVDSVGTAGENIIPRVEQILVGMGAAVQKLAPMIGEQLPPLIQAVLPSLLSAGGELLGGLANGIVTAAPALIETGVPMIASLIGGVVDAIPNLVATGKEILGAISSSVAKSLPTLANSALQIGQTLFNTIMEEAPNIFNAGISLLQNLSNGVASAIPEFLSSALPAILDFSTMLRENFGNFVDAGIDLIQNIVKGIAGGLPVLIENVPLIVSNIAGLINDNAPKILSAGINIIITLGKGLIQAIPTLIANIPQIITAIVDVITAFQWLDLGKSIIEFLGNGIKSMIAFVKSAATNVRDGIIETIKNLPQTLMELGKKLITNFGNAINSMKTWVVEKVSEIASSIITKLKKLPTDALQIGKDLLIGIWNGIWDKVEWLKSQVSGVVDTIKGWFTGKDGFDEHSPSKWGENVTNLVMVGLGNGFKKGESSLLSTADGIIDSVMSRFNETADMDLRLGGIEFDGANRNRFDFETARVGFESSVMGAPIAAAVNAISGMVSSISDRPTTYQLVTPDGKVLAEYMADPLVDHMNANGTPIVNPIS